MSDNFESNVDDVEIPLENDDELEGDQEGEGEPSSSAPVVVHEATSTLEECHLSDGEVKNDSPSQDPKKGQSSSSQQDTEDVDLNEGGEQIVKKEEEEDDGDDDDDELEYPDTNIQLQYVGGDK